MPTICGMRRRGFPAEAIRTFCDRLGISKAENNIDFTVLEDTVRESLDSSAPRLFALLNPLKVTITNWPKGKEDTFYAARHPKHDFGQRPLPFTGDVFIDRADFFDTGAAGDVRLPKGYKRLFLGGTVRLKYAYVIRCDEIVRDSNGEVVELRCTYDVSTRAKPNPNPAESDNGTDMPMRAKGAVQWVAQQYAVPIEAVLYDRLFLAASPGKSHKDGDFLKDINPHSKAVCSSAVAERSVLEADDCQAFQFERVGYFCTDGRSDARKLRFNRIVTLRDTWRGKAIVDANATEAIKPRQHSKSAATDVSKATAAAAATAAPAPVPVLVQDILRVDMRVGVILSAVKHPEADNLYVEKIDCGDKTGPRTVISGLVKHIKLHQLVGKKVVVVCNLKPSKMRGIVSEGMILAASSNTEDSEKVELVTPPDGAVAGEVILIPGYGPPQPDTQLKSKSAQEVWKRVSSQLCSNNNCIATFNQQMLMTSDGPCTVSSLRGAAIR